jgi:hypothetical protein
MIWSSIPFMTTVDVLIIAVTVYAIWSCRLIGPSKRPSAPKIGLRWIALGLLAVCLFYFADLASMYVLPVVTSVQEPAAAPAVESVRFGDFRFHLARGEVKRGEEIVRLTDGERVTLRLLAATPGETVPRQTFAGNDGATGERAVDVQVKRLRRKIEHDPAKPLLVQTVRGIGYRLVTP